MKKENAITLPSLLKASAIKSRFEEILGKNAASFISSLISIFNENEKMRKCDPTSILTAAATAANLNLPIQPQLGYAYIIPYYDYKTQTYLANFQIGVKGLLQLALRSNLFSTINTTEIYEGQIKSRNPITGEFEFGEQISDRIVGYAAYFRLLNGFSKTVYMTLAEIENHAMTFSETYRNEKTRPYSTWTKNFNAMAKKTVLKYLLKNYAPTSIQWQSKAIATALQDDQPTIQAEPYGDFVTDNNNVDGSETLKDYDEHNGTQFDEENFNATDGETI